MVLTRFRHARGVLMGRYAASSVIAGVISELAFLASYALGALPVVASGIAFVAGAVPNYLMNRYWAWQRRGRANPTREVLPYVAIIVVTALIAAGVTTLADAWLQDRIDSHLWQVLAVGAAFLATYGFMFVLKFVLFDRYVFAAPETTRTPATKSRP